AALTTVKRPSQYGKGLNPRACHHISQALVRPILLYGANLLAPTKGALHKMEVLWYKVARWVTTCLYRTNTSALLADASLPPLDLVEPEQHGMPPYKRSYPTDTPLLSHHTLKALQTHSATSSHLGWGLHLARTAPDYLYLAPTQPRRFMHLEKFKASRIPQMR